MPDPADKTKPDSWRVPIIVGIVVAAIALPVTLYLTKKPDDPSPPTPAETGDNEMTVAWTVVPDRIGPVQPFPALGLEMAAPAGWEPFSEAQRAELDKQVAAMSGPKPLLLGAFADPQKRGALTISHRPEIVDEAGITDLINQIAKPFLDAADPKAHRLSRERLGFAGLHWRRLAVHTEGSQSLLCLVALAPAGGAVRIDFVVSRQGGAKAAEETMRLVESSIGTIKKAASKKE